MKNIFRLGSNEPKRSDIKKITIISICVYLVCIGCIVGLFFIDTDKRNLTPLIRFIEHEQIYLYGEEYSPLQLNGSDKYIHSIGYDYVGTKLNAQFSELCNVISDQESRITKSVDSMESAEEFINKLIPENIIEANNWVKMFINRFAYYDLLSVIDPECEDYWQIRSYAWENIVFHSGYENIRFWAFLYDNMGSIVMCYIFIMIITFSLDVGYLSVYFCRVFKTKGANRNDVYGET